jgi:hypothetical protein
MKRTEILRTRSLRAPRHTFRTLDGCESKSETQNVSHFLIYKATNSPFDINRAWIHVVKMMTAKTDADERLLKEA